MIKFIFRLLSIATTCSVFIFSGGAALAAKNTATPAAPLGNDISWPQCNKTLPKGQAFGVVGVNNGLANNTNPCLSTQLNWALASTGGTGQPKVALYANTANPGLTGSWWPASNDYGGATVNNPYGNCDHSDSIACAYMYGYAKAYDDANIRGVSNPSGYLWWLDVETINSWESNKDANRADLEGMATYFQSTGASVGLYSTSYQWNQIVGAVNPSSSLYNLKSWLAGARNESIAKSNCSLPPLTAGGQVALTQFVSKNLDYDYSCI
jgi:type II secretory pathway pseudopilin PulG